MNSTKITETKLPLMLCRAIDSRTAIEVCVKEHYLHRRPRVSYAYGLFFLDELLGVITFGSPASRHLQMSVCPSDPSKVLELNRLWVSDLMPRNTESWFIARAIKQLPPRLLCSYADTKEGRNYNIGW